MDGLKATPWKFNGERNLNITQFEIRKSIWTHQTSMTLGSLWDIKIQPSVKRVFENPFRGS